MAKVVGRDESVVKRSTCKSCAAIIEYTPNEVISYWASDYGGGRDEYHKLICPNCGSPMHNVSKR